MNGQHADESEHGAPVNANVRRDSSWSTSLQKRNTQKQHDQMKVTERKKPYSFLLYLQKKKNTTKLLQQRKMMSATFPPSFPPA
jgi:hypothetical protein